MDYILTAPRIQKMKVEIKLVFDSMQTSQSVETKQEGENFLICRKTNEELPEKQASYSSYGKRKNRWRDESDY